MSADIDAVGRFDDGDRRRSGPPPPLDARVAALAARQHGVVALWQLSSLGLGARGAQHRAVSGRLHRIHRGVYAVGHPRLGAAGARMAAVLACGIGAVLSQRSAAALWGLLATAAARLDVTAASRGRSGPAGVVLHRTRCLEPVDVTERDGVPVTSLARTLVDLAAVVSDDQLARAVHEAEVLRLLDVGAVLEAIDRLPGRRGTGHLRALMAEPDPGLTRSELERRFVGLCRTGGLPLPRLNAAVEVAGGSFEVDALWPRERLIVELDGAHVHATRRAFHADRRRDAALAAQGHLVVRLTWQRVTRERAATTEELRRILSLRGGLC